jgi:hypothetical protein
MTTAVVVETFESLQHSTRLIPESRSRTLNYSRENPRTRTTVLTCDFLSEVAQYKGLTPASTPASEWYLAVIKYAAAPRAPITVLPSSIFLRHSETAAACSGSVQLVGDSVRKKKWTATASAVIRLKCHWIWNEMSRFVTSWNTATFRSVACFTLQN